MTLASVAVAFALGACSSSSKKSTTTTTGGGAAAPTGTTIVIGQLETQSGPAGNTKVGQTTLDAWASWTNAHGGLNGHPVKVITKNDNADPAQAQTALNSMINDDHIVALVGQNASATEPTWVNLMVSSKIPVIGGPAYDTAWFTKPYFYPTTTSVPTTVYGEIYAAKNAGGKALASLLCNNSTVCLGAVPLFNAAAKDLNMPVVYNQTASQTATDYTAQCLAMKASKADTVIAFVNNQLLANNCKQQGYNPTYIGAESSITQSQLQATSSFEGLTGPSSSFPWWQEFPQTSEFFDAMKTYAPAYAPGGSQYESQASGVLSSVFSSGVVFANAMKNAAVAADQPVTSADVVRGLAMIQNSTNGGYTPVVSYGDGTTPSKYVPCFWLYKVVNAKYTSINGLSTTCEPSSALPPGL